MRSHSPGHKLTHDAGGLTDSSLAIGTWAWGNRLLYNYSPEQDKELQKAFESAVQNGITLFDTADSYGTGRLNARAEVLLGKFMRYSAREARIATKFASYPWRVTERSIVQAAEQSCERLGRKIYIAQMHWSPSRYVPLQEGVLLRGLCEAQKAGYCEHIGVSNMGPVGLRRAQKVVEERGTRLKSVQVQMSLLCREALENGLLQTADEMGVSVIGYSPLCLGRLGGGAKRSGVRGALFDSLKNDELDRELRKVAEKHGASVGQVAVSWCVNKGVIVLAGCRNEGQVIQNVGALRVELSEEESARLEGAASRGRQMVRNAFQTA